VRWLGLAIAGLLALLPPLGYAVLTWEGFVAGRWPVALGMLALGLALGGAVHAFVVLVPQRALRRTLQNLDEAESSLGQQVAETKYAYDELARQYRIAEETAHELNVAMQQAQSANKTKSQFMAMMSHELRTPLNAIIGFSEIISRQMFGPVQPRYADYGTDILTSARHLLAIINEILDLSKIEAGKMELANGAIDIGLLVQRCVHFVEIRAREREVAVAVELPADLPVLHGDEVKLKQVMLNILSNAVKFTPAGGSVTVKAEAPVPGRVRVIVRDTGVGMAAHEIPRALQPFQQVDNSLARKHEGTGLGLPLACGLVELHGGKLVIDSEPGIGTTVTIDLPLGQRPQASTAVLAA
jgi:signal transduction histidine kinase